MNTIALFPTFIHRSFVKDISLCNRIEDAARNIRDLRKGTFYRGDDNNFVTDDNLHELTEFSELCKMIIEESAFAFDFYAVKRDRHYITSMWSYITTSNYSLSTHIHQNSFFSGVFYAKAPKNCGKLRLMDPRPAKNIINPEYERVNDANMGIYELHPTTGEMLMFPSWLPHDVFAGQSEEERISVAFNIMMKGTYKYHAQSIVY